MLSPPRKYVALLEKVFDVVKVFKDEELLVLRNADVFEHVCEKYRTMYRLVEDEIQNVK